MESNAIQVIRAINGETHYPCLITTSVQNIWEEYKKFDKIIIRYCNRKGNKVTNYLGKSEQNIEEERLWIDKFPHRIIQLV